MHFLQDNNNRFYPLYGTVEKILQKKRSKRGRPAKDEPVEYQELYRVRVDIGELDQKLLNQEKERLSCFVLITNIFNSSYSVVDILREYKQQSIVENKFKFIKNPLYVGSLYIQKKDRLEALSYVIFMALLLYSILERRVRRALLDEDEPLVLMGKKKSFRPTGNRILEILRPVKVLSIRQHNKVIRYLPDNYIRKSRVVSLAGFDMNIYIRPPGSI